MDELVNIVSQKTGLSEEKANVAVELVVEFLKGKLPGPVAAQIDGILSRSAAGGAAGLGKKLGGILGRE